MKVSTLPVNEDAGTLLMKPNTIAINLHVLADLPKTSHLPEAMVKAAKTGTMTRFANVVVAGNAITTKIAREIPIPIWTTPTLSNIQRVTARKLVAVIENAVKTLIATELKTDQKIGQTITIVPAVAFRLMIETVIGKTMMLIDMAPDDIVLLAGVTGTMMTTPSIAAPDMMTRTDSLAIKSRRMVYRTSELEVKIDLKVAERVTRR